MPTPTPQIDLFRLRTPLQIRYGDIDMLQHVNNARYFSYMEDSRIHYAQEVLDWDGSAEQLGMILAHTEVDFLQPIFLGDSVELLARCAKLGVKSFTFEYLFLRRKHRDGAQGEKELCATGKAVVVAWDLHTQQSQPIPEELRKRIERYEPGL